MRYKIEKNIPIPAFRQETSGLTEVLRKLEIGDSIFTEMDGASLSPIITRLQNKIGRKFSRRKQGNGYRVWRIS